MKMKTLSAAFRHLTAATLAVLFTAAAQAAPDDINKPLLVIGASFANGKTPFNDASVAPLGGVSVGLGSYLSLGDALVKNPRLPGYVINEAQAGATSFDRVGCNPGPACVFGNWKGYDRQLMQAAARVTVPGTSTLLAKYVVISLGNDCLHSDAFGVPQSQATPCSYNDMKAYVDRLIAVGRHATDLGLTPVYDIYPAYDSLNLPFAAQAFGLNWIVDRSSYNQLRDLHRTRIPAMLPNAVMLDIWSSYQNIGDGLHPDPRTTRRAAELIAWYIGRPH